MAKKKAQLNKHERQALQTYITTLKSRMSVDGVLLFGSRAYGKPTKHSDIDVVVVSNHFKKMDFFDRLSFLSLLRKDVAEDIALDVIGYTPAEFARGERQSAILKKAKNAGVWVA